jgi:hypothetical protein
MDNNGNSNAKGIIIAVVVIVILIIIGVVSYFLYKEFSCPKTSDINATCKKNCDCKNGACGRETAADGANLICCPSGKTDLYGGYDYCTGMPDGSDCWSDAMCAGGTCEGNVYGVKKGKCTGNSKPGQSCTSNDNCSNKACGRETAADGAKLVCCPSGKTDLYGGFDYCTQMPDGSTCWSNAMCSSGFCRDNAGGLKKGTCGKVATDGKCSSNSDCTNGACGRKTAADGAELICCPSGKTDLYDGYDYCTGMPDGSTCWSDAMCANGYCRDNAGGLKKGTCGKVATDGKCSSNSDCTNGACGRKTAADGAELICCPSGKTDLYGGFDYCTQMPKGSTCWSDAMCASGSCSGNRYGLRKGTCT